MQSCAKEAWGGNVLGVGASDERDESRISSTLARENPPRLPPGLGLNSHLQSHTLLHPNALMLIMVLRLPKYMRPRLLQMLCSTL